MLPGFIDKEKIPHKPGIYIYKNDEAKVIYVGKAIDLYNRVSSYFNSKNLIPRTATMVSNIRSIETIIVDSELEALILEASYIKKFLPIYNVNLKDDKDYLYIVITKAEFPKVITARRKEIKGNKGYYGPFPSAQTVKRTLKQLRRIFPWCSNPPGSGNKNSKPCFYYHIKLCPGACVGAISAKDYNKILSNFSKFLDGRKQELLEELEYEMNQYAKDLKYEEAAKIKRTIDGINYITQSNRVSSYLENPNFIQDLENSSLIDLQNALGLKEIPERIEAYDISNFQGTDSTGSMVVLTHGEVDKSQYRRFKIKITGKPNDYAMHSEMMQRRLKHKEWPFPQLFLIDGGRGQVRASKAELEAQGVDIPIYGLAKRMEWLYPPEGEVVRLPRKNLGLRLLQKIRDESHRFAITYHRKLRAKSSGYV